MTPHAETLARAEVVARAARLWRDRAYPSRASIAPAIAERTAYGVAMVEYALDRLFGSLNRDALVAAIEGELGEDDVEPLGNVAVISSRTTIGVAIVPAAFAFCAGCNVLVKDREDALVSAFFQTIVEQRGTVPVPTLAAKTWNGAEHDLSGFEAVVAFGSEETLRALRCHAPKARFISFGPACSIGYVCRETLGDPAHARDVARGAARDLVLYEGEGCMSLHALFVETGAAPLANFADTLGREIEAANAAFPSVRQEDAFKRMTARDLALFRGTLLASGVHAEYVLVAGDPERPPSFVPRVLALHAAEKPAAMREYVTRHGLAAECCAISADREDAVSAAYAAGCSRIARFGEMQSPSLDYLHGGQTRIAEFVRRRVTAST